LFYKPGLGLFSWNCKRHITGLWLCNFRACNTGKANWHLSKTVTWH